MSYCMHMQVNAKAVGKAAIHCAAVAGHMNVLKAILEFNPDLEIQVRNFCMMYVCSLHFCSKKYLIGHGMRHW